MLDRPHNDCGAALKKMQRDTQHETVDWIQHIVPARERPPSHCSRGRLDLDLEEEVCLQDKRHFMKVTFLNNQAMHPRA